MLEKAHISVTFDAGIDEKTTPQLLQDGKQAVVLNGVFTKNGSIRKRFGTKKLGTTPSSVPFRLNTFQNELTAVCADGVLRGLSPNITPNGQNWVPRSFVPEAVASRTALTAKLTGLQEYDLAIWGSTACAVYVANDGSPQVTGVIFDVITGAVILQPIAIGGVVPGKRPRVVAVGATFCVTWFDLPTNRIAAANISATNPITWSGATVLVAYAASTAGAYDFVPVVGSANSALLVFENNLGGANTITNILVNVSTLVLGTTTNIAAVDTAIGAIAASAFSGDGTFWVAYSRTNGVDSFTRLIGLNSATLAMTSGPTTVITNLGWAPVLAGGFSRARVGIARVNANTLDIVSSVFPGGGTELTSVMSNVRCLAGAVQGAQGDTRRLFMLGRPFFNAANSQTYLTAFFCNVNGTSIQSTTWLVALRSSLMSPNGFRAVCTLAPWASTSQRNQGVPAISSIIATTSTTYMALVDINVNNTVSGLEVATLDFSTNGLQRGAEFSHQLLLSGGAPSFYDGETAAEVGFFAYPEGVTVQPMGAGTGNLNLVGATPAVFLYSVVYEWYDAQGQYHESQPSVAVQASLNGVANGSVRVTVPCLNLTGRALFTDGPVGIAIYRSQMNLQTMYRVEAEVLPSTSSNNPLAGFIVIVDIASDVAIGSHRPIWNTAGNVARICPPSASTVLVHKERAWLAGGDDPRNVWFSGTLTDGTAPWFSIAFIQRFPEPIVALASMDGRLIAFSRYSIFIMDGDGPSDTAQGSDLTSPQRIACPSGCVEPRSVIRCSQGILFQSEQGLSLLDRSMSVTYFGKNVEDTLGQFSTLTSATFLEDQGQVRFTTDDGGGTGRTIIYDDVQRAWSLASYRDSVTPFAPNAAVGATGWGPNGWVFCMNANVYQEDRNGNLDFGTIWIPLTVQSNWLKPQANQGFGRFWLCTFLGEYRGGSDTKMSIQYDYDPVTIDSHTWPLVTGVPPAPSNAGRRLQLSMKPSRQKCEAMRVTISDAQPAIGWDGSAGGWYAIALDLEIGSKQGNMKLPAAARF